MMRFLRGMANLTRNLQLDLLSLDDPIRSKADSGHLGQPPPFGWPRSHTILHFTTPAGLSSAGVQKNLYTWAWVDLIHRNPPRLVED